MPTARSSIRAAYAPPPHDRAPRPLSTAHPVAGRPALRLDGSSGPLAGNKPALSSNEEEPHMYIGIGTALLIIIILIILL
jgi:hypothetical protein